MLICHSTSILRHCNINTIMTPLGPFSTQSFNLLGIRMLTFETLQNMDKYRGFSSIGDAYHLHVKFFICLFLFTFSPSSSTACPYTLFYCLFFVLLPHKHSRSIKILIFFGQIYVSLSGFFGQSQAS